MKKVIPLFIFVFVSSLVSAQVSISCKYKEFCEWNENTKKWSSDCSGYEESSLFVWNKDETMFTHTTESIKSTYYVQSKEYDEVNDIHAYNVISDVGNKYYFIFDLKNEEIRAMSTNDDAELILIRWYIKAVF